MESSEDDAGTATTASRRVSAREKDIGQAEDDNATGSAVHRSGEARASCGTPAMSEDNFDGDSVPSPSTQDVNTSTEAILDMIDEFVDGPGAPKRLPLTSTDDASESECAISSDQTSTREASIDDTEVPLPPPSASPTTSAKSDPEPQVGGGDAPPECTSHSNEFHLPEVVNTDCIETQQDCSVTVCDTNLKSVASDNREEPSEEIQPAIECPPEPSAVDSVSVCPLEPSGESVPSNSQPEASTKSELNIECQQETSGVSAEPSECAQGPSDNSVVSSDLPKESFVEVNVTSESQCPAEETAASSESQQHAQDVVEAKESPQAPCVESNECHSEATSDQQGPSTEPEVSCETPPVNIPSSSIEESVQSVSDLSECERHKWTVKCVTSSDSRHDVTIESAESTSSDISLSEEKVTGAEQLTRSPLRRRLVRPAPVDRRPDSTVSSTVDINSTQQMSSESLAKDVSSSSDAVPSVHGNVKPEEIRNVSEISVCKAETSVSPPKRIKLIRQKVSAPTLSRDDVPSNQSSQAETDQCQSTSSDSSSLVDSPHNIAKSDILPEDQVRSVDDSERNINVKVPAAQVECIPHQDTAQKNEESTSSVDKSTPELGSDEKDVSVNVDANTPDTLPDTKSKEVTVSHTNEHVEPETESPKQVPKLTIKLGGNKQSEEMKSPVPKLTIKPIKPPADDINKETDIPVPNVTKLYIKPIVKPTERNTDTLSAISEHHTEDDSKSTENIPVLNVTKLNIKPIVKPSEKIADSPVKSTEHVTESKAESSQSSESMPIPNVTKLNIKPVLKPSERSTSTTSKVPDKSEINADSSDQMESMPIPNVTKINIKPIVRPTGSPMKSTEHLESKGDSEQIPCITKLNIKPIPKPAEKINDTHRKSSSSEISESEGSENDDSTSNSDQASASDQGPSDVVPKVTIKLGKPGTTSEGKFYAEKNIPKLTIKGLQHNEEEPESASKLTLVINQPEEHSEKVPKLTIKTVSKSESQPLSPKLTIKPLKPPDTLNKESNVDHSDTKITKSDPKENVHVPKITIKPVTKPDFDSKSNKRSAVSCASPEPKVTKLNIKPVLKPTDGGSISDNFDDKVPVVSKLNIKPIVKPKDNEVDSSLEDVPKITKLNIKPLKNLEADSSEVKDCDELNVDMGENSIPVVSKLNIKPIVKPPEEDSIKDSENQSSETGNSSDDNGEHIPVVTKINIKPIIKPNEMSDTAKHKITNDESTPIITKLNIKPLVKPEESSSPLSPKKDSLRNVESRNSSIPVVTKLNIKPVIKPEETDLATNKEGTEDKSEKNPPLVMKINRKAVADNSFNETVTGTKTNNIDGSEHVHNNVEEEVPTLKLTIKPVLKVVDSQKGSDILETDKSSSSKPESSASTKQEKDKISKETPKQNCVSESSDTSSSSDDIQDSKEPTQLLNDNHSVSVCQVKSTSSTSEHKTVKSDSQVCKANSVTSVSEGNKMGLCNEKVSSNKGPITDNAVNTMNKQVTSVNNCTLLKKLLESNEGLHEKSMDLQMNVYNSSSATVTKDTLSYEQFDSGHSSMEKVNDIGHNDSTKSRSPTPEKINDVNTPQVSLKIRPIQELCKELSESVTKPLEVTISEKLSNQSSGQDSPRIILKINKTDHGPSAKIITEEVNKNEVLHHKAENATEISNEKQSPTKKNIMNSKRKPAAESPVTIGKRLRSSRIVENADKSKTPILKKLIGKRPPTADTSPPNKETELTVLESKRLKLGQLLSNKSLTITPVITKKSPDAKPVEIKQGPKAVNHTLVNNENCSKNGNSKLHNILSNLQAKQLSVMPFNDINCSDKNPITPEVESNTSTGSSDVIEILRGENCHPDVQEMMINENSDFRDFSIGGDDMSQDPLEIETPRTDTDSLNESGSVPQLVAATPQPKKRGRPRKLPVSEEVKVPLPVPALEERPQRSLRLSRDRPAILAKPRGGRGRGRGRGRGKGIDTPSDRRDSAHSTPETPEVVNLVDSPERSVVETPRTPEPIDPTSSRVKLPRMTEALDRLPASCATPLSSRHIESFDAPELKVVLENTPVKKCEESPPDGGTGGKGSRGGWRGRGRGSRTPAKSPRVRGRGRGGGRGAMYMKETMGIYGRVCGPATTTVQLFEEETCMMDDNATPAKPTHLLDEDSQSSVKSSTNESSKMKKSKFADLFDSNKEWTAADVKEYIWPPADKPDEESHVMMIQEQVAMFLGVKSFKRRYPELARRSVAGAERDYVLSRGLVSEALCDLGITAVDASEVLDIMLSDYPHKYEEYRNYQRKRQLAASEEGPEEAKTEEQAVDKVEIKIEIKTETKPEVPKVDPEKTRQDLALAAAASAAEWNARLNALRRPACADLQTLSLHTRRPPRRPPPRPHLRPPAGFYPHALLPGQYQHSYRVYTPQQLRYFPLNTAVEAPPAPPAPATSSESEPDSDRSDCSHDSDRLPAKRKKLTKVKRSNSQTESRGGDDSREAEVVDLCRVCKLRLEANRKHTHERFLVCADCNCKLHPICTELSADTIRKCRNSAWQCSSCKTCGVCGARRPPPPLRCDLCDHAFHPACLRLPASPASPAGRWHCSDCAICKSCGARSPSGPAPAPAPAPAPDASPGGTPGPPPAPAEWHHQTKRGPGGHKVYSHSLCTPCARAYRIGRYCPLCERSFIGPKGTMQLVICKLCDRQLHQECVRQSVSSLNVLDYTCGECRRGGITSRAAAVRLAPRTIATLFMAKRRFNKYAHRQYLASRRRGTDADADAEAEAEVEADAEAEPEPEAEAEPAPPAAPAD